MTRILAKTSARMRTRTTSATPQADPGGFDNGSGKEIFAYIPRTVMPTLTGFANSVKHQYTVDGTPRAADVFIDPVKEAGSTVFPDPNQREWRTVVITGFREGGRGYFALDITQPSPVTDSNPRAPGVFVPEDDYIDLGASTTPANLFASAPTCMSTDTDGDGIVDSVPAGCGSVPFPAPLWNFDDTILDSGIRYQLDEDGPLDGGGIPVGNGLPDLGSSWSTPNIGRIRICKAGGTKCHPDISGDPTAADHLVDRFVAVFGGGMDRDSKTTPVSALRGNWLYMVDVETGQVIYKRQLIGAAPSEPAAVDTDQDGYLDRVYLGTIAGNLYRVDLKPDASGNLPALVPTTVRGLDPAGGPSTTLSTLRIPASAWVPHILFDTRAPSPTASTPYRPIYERPSVIFVAKLGLYALAFGTGDREDLWSTISDAGRFYVFVDDVTDLDALATPKTELVPMPLAAIAPDDAFTSANTDFLLDVNHRGWVLQLGANERVITDAFALSGVTVFSSFTPKVVDENGAVINVGCSSGGTGHGGGGPGPPVATCARLGDSQIFVVNTTNANGLLVSDSGADTRYRVLANFVTNPFAEPGATKRAAGTGSGSDQHNADELTPRLTQIMNGLKALFPANCKFANYRIDIKTIAADTSLEFIAPVPVCIIERNWKEF